MAAPVPLSGFVYNTSPLGSLKGWRLATCASERWCSGMSREGSTTSYFSLHCRILPCVALSSFRQILSVSFLQTSRPIFSNFVKRQVLLLVLLLVHGYPSSSSTSICFLFLLLFLRQADKLGNHVTRRNAWDL